MEEQPQQDTVVARLGGFRHTCFRTSKDSVPELEEAVADTGSFGALRGQKRFEPESELLVVRAHVVC